MFRSTIKSSRAVPFCCACLLAMVAPCLPGADTPAKGTAVQQLTQAPSTQEELGDQVCAALDAGDDDALLALMAPASLVDELGDPDDKPEYLAHVKNLPVLAGKLRAYLAEKKLLPLKGMKVMATNAHPRKDEVNGKTIQFSTGIMLVKQVDGKDAPVLELIDQAVAVDGRWYVGRLTPESLEKELMK